MKTKLLIPLILFLAFIAQAGTNSVLKFNSSEFYHANEFALGASATYTRPLGKLNDALDGSWDHGSAGWSVEARYFPKLNFGIGVDIGVPDIRRSSTGVIDEVNVNAIARLPLGRFAPFLSGGAGKDLARGDSTASVGIGLEARLWKGFGALAEYRYRWSLAGQSDTGQLRAGITLSF